jgi:hypothetical protein
MTFEGLWVLTAAPFGEVSGTTREFLEAFCGIFCMWNFTRFLRDRFNKAATGQVFSRANSTKLWSTFLEKLDTLIFVPFLRCTFRRYVYVIFGIFLITLRTWKLIGTNDNILHIRQETKWSCPGGGVVYIVLSSPPANEEIGAMGREIESCQGIGW